MRYYFVGMGAGNGVVHGLLEINVYGESSE